MHFMYIFFIIAFDAWRCIAIQRFARSWHIVAFLDDTFDDMVGAAFAAENP